MEHRHFKRKPTDLTVKLTINDDQSYPAQVLEMSAIGMRVLLKEKLPNRVKLVNIVFPTTEHNTQEEQYMRMFVVWKDDYELGLCLVNERTKIDLDWPQYENSEVLSVVRKLAANSK